MSTLAMFMLKEVKHVHPYSVCSSIDRLILNDKRVLAYNLYWCGTGGSPPFYGNCIYGANNELRGYTAGRYLDRYMFATQLEYRLVLPWKFGLVGFGSVGCSRSGLRSVLSSEPSASRRWIRHSLPFEQEGSRQSAADFAWGKDNFTWGVDAGEAF